MTKTYRVGIVGASGLVGNEILSIIEERSFPTESVRLFASERSLGHTHLFRNAPLPIEVLGNQSFDDLDICFFTAGAKVSRQYVPIAVSRKVLCIDNTSAFRMDEEVPLVVPEINSEAMNPANSSSLIIANPNCVAVPICLVLDPLAKEYGLRRVVVSSYQAVSGAGRRATEELSSQVVGMFGSGKITKNIFPHQIAFNLIPAIAEFGDQRYTGEEEKIISETRKILGFPALKITATAVRVPVFNSHSASVNVEFEHPFELARIFTIFNDCPGVELVDEPENNLYPMPLKVTNKDDVQVGRIRRDWSVDNGINLFVAGDNLRKGAALNAVQIAERYVGFKVGMINRQSS